MNSLVAEVLDNQRASFDKLVDLLKERGIRVAYHIVGNLEDAKDVLQEAFIKLYVNISKFKARSSFSTWFHRIVVNCAYDFLKKKKAKKRITPLSLTDNKDSQIDVSDENLRPDMRWRLDSDLVLERFIDMLSVKQKQAIILRYKNGFSMKETAQIIGCKVSTTKVHLFRAIKRLRKMFYEQEKQTGGRNA